jgi:hypothetical protein
MAASSGRKHCLYRDAHSSIMPPCICLSTFTWIHNTPIMWVLLEAAGCASTVGEAIWVRASVARLIRVWCGHGY